MNFNSKNLIELIDGLSVEISNIEANISPDDRIINMVLDAYVCGFKSGLDILNDIVDGFPKDIREISKNKLKQIYIILGDEKI